MLSRLDCSFKNDIAYRAQPFEGRWGFALKVSVLLLIAVIGVTGIWASRGLFADGSWFLFNILTHEGYWKMDMPRLFAQFINQGPVVLALSLGEHDIDRLVLYHSVGLIGAPVFIWMIALLLHLRTSFFWVLLLMFSVTYLTTGFFAIGEYNVAYALVGYCCALGFKERMGVLSLFGGVLAALALTRSYEAMVFLGPVLFMVFYQRGLTLNERSGLVSRLSVPVILFLLASASAFSVWSIMFPRDPANLARAGEFYRLLVSPHFIFICVMLVCYAALRSLSGWGMRIVAACIPVIAIIYLLDGRYWLSPKMNYEFRSLSGLLLMMLIFVVWQRGNIRGLMHPLIFPAKGNAGKLAPLASAMLFCVLTSVLLTHTYTFAQWLGRYDKVATGLGSWQPLERTALYSWNDYYEFSWNWTNPVLSILLRGDSKAGVLNSTAYEGWRPFDPNKLGQGMLPAIYRSGSVAEVGVD